MVDDETDDIAKDNVTSGLGPDTSRSAAESVEAVQNKISIMQVAFLAMANNTDMHGSPDRIQADRELLNSRGTRHSAEESGKVRIRPTIAELR